MSKPQPSPASDALPSGPPDWQNSVAKPEGFATQLEGTQESRSDVAKPSEFYDVPPLCEGSLPTTDRDDPAAPHDPSESPPFQYVMARYCHPQNAPRAAAGPARANQPRDAEVDHAFRNLLRRDLIPHQTDEPLPKGGRPPVLNELTKAQIISLLSVGFTRQRSSTITPR